MTDYFYWVVSCQTKGCENPILLYFLGPQDPSSIPALDAPESFAVKCPSCRQTNTYRREDVHTKIGSLPPADFAPHPQIHPANP